MVISPQPLGPDDIWPGRLCVWLHTPRGGYGYTIRIPAKVVERLPNGRVVILAALASGGCTQVVTSQERLVQPNALDRTPPLGTFDRPV